MKIKKYVAIACMVLLTQCTPTDDSKTTKAEEQVTQEAAVTVSKAVAPVTKAAASGKNEKLEWSTVAGWNLPAKPLSFVHSLDNKLVFILTDNNQVNIFSSRGSLKGTVPVDSGVTSIDISPYGDTLYLIDTSANSFKAVTVDFIVNFANGDSPYLGPKDAPVTITLFTDFE